MVSYRYLYTWLSGDVDFCIYYHADHEECLLHAKNHFHKLEACKSLIIDVVNNSPLDPSGQPLAIYSRNEQGYEFYKTYES